MYEVYENIYLLFWHFKAHIKYLTVLSHEVLFLVFYNIQVTYFNEPYILYNRPSFAW